MGIGFNPIQYNKICIRPEEFPITMDTPTISTDAPAIPVASGINSGIAEMVAAKAELEQNLNMSLLMMNDSLKMWKDKLVADAELSTVRVHFFPETPKAPIIAQPGEELKIPLEPDEMFDKFMNFVFEDEGGFSNHAKDPGGATNMGICKKWYDANRGKASTMEEFRNMTKEEAKTYYYNYFWIPSGAAKLANEGNEQLAYMVFDTAIHSGIGKAKRLLKQSNGDAEKMADARLAQLKTSKNWDTFGKGWTNRMNRIEDRLDCMA